MKFLHNDLGVMHGSEVIEITLNSAANVRLMDMTNFQRYKAGRNHDYFGGHVTRSPFQITVPHMGHWHLAIDLGGYDGRVSASVRVIN